MTCFHDRYRNYLMACTALMSQTRQLQYRTMLETRPAPGIRNLQTLLESAWENGANPLFASHVS